jgi:type IV fimbrial biogenesis protein FimT
MPRPPPLPTSPRAPTLARLLRRCRPPRRGRGLTLLEVMAALAVVAVLAALALPAMGTLIHRQRLQATAEALAADLSEARFEAARRGQALHVQTQSGATDRDWCWGVSTSPGCGCQPPRAQCQLRAVQAHDHGGVRLQGGLSTRFDPVGGGTAEASATFESPRGERLRVELNPMGRARVCVPGPAAAAPSARYPRC